MSGDETDAEPNDLDADHVAELANLPLDEEETETLEEACREVLDAFQLAEREEADEDLETSRTFADEPEPWPREGVAAILDQVPNRDGRQLEP